MNYSNMNEKILIQITYVNCLFDSIDSFSLVKNIMNNLSY